MAEPFSRFNDGNSQAPRLRVGIAYSTLRDLPLTGAQWSLEEKLERVRDAGFECIECEPEDEPERFAPAMARHDLHLAMRGTAEHIGHLRQAVKRANDLGADYLVLQVAPMRASRDEAEGLLLDGPNYARDHDLPLWIHTRRGTATATVSESFEIIDRVPALRFACDLAEYFVAGAWQAVPREGLTGQLAGILTRTSHLYGRVSNGHAIQIDLGDGRGHFARSFIDLWSIAMRAWIQGAHAGDLMPFTCLLEPPPIAQTGADGCEWSDRWTQSLLLKQVAQRAWECAQGDEEDPPYSCG